MSRKGKKSEKTGDRGALIKRTHGGIMTKHFHMGCLKMKRSRTKTGKKTNSGMKKNLQHREVRNKL